MLIAMKVIFENDYLGYEKSFKILMMEKLHDSRERLSLNFAKKCLKHESFSDVSKEFE